ncbi:MAG: Rrf2 family transcriptional regulator [Nitrospirota bacterium]|nr:MAG: Rrf2 family transcriptional regulator [Nitrospirota bacterium]
MEITRETDYAIRCVLFLSKEPKKVFMVSEIADKQKVPKAFLAKILQKLVKGKIATSIRGVKGGFMITKPPRQITMLEVIEAVSGPFSLNTCVLDDTKCERSNYCSVHPIFVDLQKEFAEKIKKINFKQLVDREKALIKGNRSK